MIVLPLLKIINEKHIPKNNDHASRWNCLCHLWIWCSYFSTLLWLFLHLRCEVMGPCFIYGYESMQKICFIIVNHCQTLDWNIPHKGVFVPRSSYLVHSFLILKFSVNMQSMPFFKCLPCLLPHFQSVIIRYHFVDFRHHFGQPLRCSLGSSYSIV